MLGILLFKVNLKLALFVCSDGYCSKTNIATPVIALMKTLENPCFYSNCNMCVNRKVQVPMNYFES